MNDRERVFSGRGIISNSGRYSGIFVSKFENYRLIFDKSNCRGLIFTRSK